MNSTATTVTEYLHELPQEKRAALEAVRKVIKKNLPKGYTEVVQYGMISYVVPLSLYPEGYLGKKDVPIPYIALASQKNHLSLYLMNIYGTEDAQWFESEYKKSGKKLDMGKSCLRFKKIDDLPLELIGEAVARTPVQQFIAAYEKGRAKKK